MPIKNTKFEFLALAALRNYRNVVGAQHQFKVNILSIGIYFIKVANPLPKFELSATSATRILFYPAAITTKFELSSNLARFYFITATLPTTKFELSTCKIPLPEYLNNKTNTIASSSEIDMLFFFKYICFTDYSQSTVHRPQFTTVLVQTKCKMSKRSLFRWHSGRY
jgi:hypothetical protein